MEDLIIKCSKQTSNDKPFISFKKDEYWKWLSNFADGEELVVVISSKRSLEQNALFHKWVRIISDEIGEDFNTTKSWLVYKFFGYTEKTIDNVTIPILVSTSTVPKKEFAKKMEEINTWAFQDLNIVLPSNQLL